MKIRGKTYLLLGFIQIVTLILLSNFWALSFGLLLITFGFVGWNLWNFYLLNRWGDKDEEAKKFVRALLKDEDEGKEKKRKWFGGFA